MKRTGKTILDARSIFETELNLGVRFFLLLWSLVLWQDNLRLLVRTFGDSKDDGVSDLPMHCRFPHGWDGLLCGIGMEHADKGITSRKLGFCPLWKEVLELHFPGLEPEIWNKGIEIFQSGRSRITHCWWRFNIRFGFYRPVFFVAAGVRREVRAEVTLSRTIFCEIVHHCKLWGFRIS